MSKGECRKEKALRRFPSEGSFRPYTGLASQRVKGPGSDRSVNQRLPADYFLFLLAFFLLPFRLPFFLVAFFAVPFDAFFFLRVAM